MQLHPAFIFTPISVKPSILLSFSGSTEWSHSRIFPTKLFRFRFDSCPSHNLFRSWPVLLHDRYNVWTSSLYNFSLILILLLNQFLRFCDVVLSSLVQDTLFTGMRYFSSMSPSKCRMLCWETTPHINRLLAIHHLYSMRIQELLIK